MSESIPWDEIDEEIRPLVEELDRWPGLEPVGSCAGHEPCVEPDYYEGYVAFRVSGIEALERFLEILPFRVDLPRKGVWASQRLTGSFRNSCQDSKLTFFLGIGGAPLESQRVLLRDVARRSGDALGQTASAERTHCHQLGCIDMSACTFRIPESVSCGSADAPQRHAGNQTPHRSLAPCNRWLCSPMPLGILRLSSFLLSSHDTTEGNRGASEAKRKDQRNELEISFDPSPVGQRPIGYPSVRRIS